MPVFRDERDRQLYVQLMLEQARAHGLRFLAWCLMENHVHLIVIPRTEQSLARGIGEAHRRYTWQVNRREGVVGWLFQGRFYSCPLDEKHGIAAIRYVERNPVRAGVVSQAWEHAWSSAAFHVGQRTDDPLVGEPGDLGSPADWRKWLECDPQEMALLRKATRTGRPCGSPRFTAELEQFTGRRLTPSIGGRPRQDA